MKHASLALLATVGAFALGACAHAPRAVGPAEPVTADAPIAGRYVAVADGAEATLLLGRELKSVKGAVVSGAFVATAILPAADGLGLWLLVVDHAGRVQRVRDGGRLEDVGARYGVDAMHVVDLCAMDEHHVAFFAADETAIVGEGSARRYRVGGSAHACGGGRVARGEHEVFAWDGAWTMYPIASRTFALTDDGALWVAHGEALYRAQHGQLLLEHDAGAPIDGVAALGNALVLRLGSMLARFDGTRRVPLTGVEVEVATRLVSTTNAVWLLGPSSARRLAFSAPPAQHGFDTIAPIVAHSCGTCHKPGGRGGFDLTVESAWHERRSEIMRRVLEDRDMPPEGAAKEAQLGDEERDALRRWLK